MTGAGRLVVLGSLAVAAAALAVSVAALHEARDVPSYAEITAAGVEEFTDARNRMTPTEVLKLLGKPDQVFRNNPRALCWAYTAPFEIRMCWGPKRQAAWIGWSPPTPSDRFEELRRLCDYSALTPWGRSCRNVNQYLREPSARSG